MLLLYSASLRSETQRDEFSSVSSITLFSSLSLSLSLSLACSVTLTRVIIYASAITVRLITLRRNHHRHLNGKCTSGALDAIERREIATIFFHESVASCERLTGLDSSSIHSVIFDAIQTRVSPRHFAISPRNISTLNHVYPSCWLSIFLRAIWNNRQRVKDYILVLRTIIYVIPDNNFTSMARVKRFLYYTL